MVQVQRVSFFALSFFPIILPNNPGMHRMQGRGTAQETDRPTKQTLLFARPDPPKGKKLTLSLAPLTPPHGKDRVSRRPSGASESSGELQLREPTRQQIKASCIQAPRLRLGYKPAARPHSRFQRAANPHTHTQKRPGFDPRRPPAGENKNKK